MDESTERLIRVEQILEHHCKRSEERHTDVMKLLSPAIEKLEKHTVSIAILKRDRKWLYGIVAFIGASFAAVLKYLPHS